MERLDLNGSWKLKETQGNESMPVKVPGSVLSGLLENQKIEDPFYRDNEYETRELFRKDYEFERTFEAGEELIGQDQVELVCEGLDTLADIYVNGTLAAVTENMHRTYRIPVRELLKNGENHIRILFHSVLQYMENYESEENKEVKYEPCGCMRGNHLVRKAHSMFGWDWGPQLIDAGIFRDIYLEGNSGARLKEVHIRQKTGRSMADVSVKVRLKKLGESLNEDWTVSAEIAKEHGEVIDSQTFVLRDLGQEIWRNPDEDIETELSLHVTDPKLWWPNGYGEQPLYEVRVTVSAPDGKEVTSDRKIIGLRSLTVSQEKDQWGSEFAFMVNGRKIFTRGANYIPEDCVYSRITRERQEYLLKSCVRANYNCVRVWGGGYYPSDDFYDLCDRLGLIVWQDLMYACNVYDVTDQFAESCRLEALDNVRRLRHHASLGLWCGNNEIESGWDHWDDFQKETMQLRMDYVKLFEYILPKAVKEADPDTFYWASSPSSGGCFDAPDDENRGDVHYWAVWHGQKPFTDYRNYFFRFCSEFGFQSFPCRKTVDTYTLPEDRNIFSKVMESHQKNDAANGKILYYLSENFRYPKDFDSLLYISQVLQGVAIKYGCEHWRRNRGRCMGTLYWQVNDNWPVASWSSIDYFGRWKALHYMAVKFFAPVTASLEKTEDSLSVYLANETDMIQKCTVQLRIRDLDLRVIREWTEEGSADAFGTQKVLQVSLEEALENCEQDQVFAEAVVTLADGRVLTECETFVPYKHINLKKEQPKIETEERDGQFVIRLTSNVFMPYVELDFADADVIFSDNFFSITGTEPMEIVIDRADILKGSFADVQDLKQRLQIRSLADSY